MDIMDFIENMKYEISDVNELHLEYLANYIVLTNVLAFMVFSADKYCAV
jgi:hypothetical protein